MIIPVHTSDQIRTVASLAHQIWTEHYTPIIGTEQVKYMLERFQSAEAITEQIETEGYLYYLLTNDTEDIGYMAIQPRGNKPPALLGEKNELFLSKFYILSPYRGKKHARKALDFLESLARELSLPVIRLTVNKHNTQAISAYKALGFRITEPIIQDIGGGYVMDDFRMEKDLSQRRREAEDHNNNF